MIYAHKGALVTDVIHTGSRRDGVSSSAQIMGVSRGRISVKGKTNEKMDDVGAGVGIEVHAVCLVEELRS